MLIRVVAVIAATYGGATLFTKQCLVPLIMAVHEEGESRAVLTFITLLVNVIGMCIIAGHALWRMKQVSAGGR